MPLGWVLTHSLLIINAITVVVAVVAVVAVVVVTDLLIPLRQVPETYEPYKEGPLQVHQALSNTVHARHCILIPKIFLALHSAGVRYDTLSLLSCDTP